jgi:hypothetical protein
MAQTAGGSAAFPGMSGFSLLARWRESNCVQSQWFLSVFQALFSCG